MANELEVEVMLVIIFKYFITGDKNFILLDQPLATKQKMMA